MPDWVRQALAKGWKILTDYPKKQARFLTEPTKFIAGLEFGTWETKKDAFEVLVLGGTIALVLHKNNVHLYDERIRRVIEIQDKAVNTVYLLAAVAAFAFLSFVPFRILGGRGTFVANGMTLMYAVGFTVPVATLLFVVMTRLESAMLDAAIVLIPPLKIAQFSNPDASGFSKFVLGAEAAIRLLWNIYFSVLLWLALCAANQINRLRGIVALIAAVALLFSLGGWLGRLVEMVVKPLRPLLEWIL